MNDNLPKEYFDLIRHVVHEKKIQDEETVHDRPLKRHRRNRASPPTQKEEVINLDSEPEEVLIIDSELESEPEPELEVESEQEDDFNSDEFEDVSDVDEIRNISITINKNNTTETNGKTRAPRNVCCNEERKRRKYIHMFYLVCLITHGSIRNEWLNNPKLIKRLNTLVPDNVLSLLHPKKDNELILRSSRKLLDGLKKCMEIWKTHWRLTTKYNNSIGLYMRDWDEIAKSPENYHSKYLSKKLFIRQVLKGVGDRDLAQQGFVALLRSCNVNARLVFSCQPPDFSNLKNDCTNKTPDSYDDMIKYPLFWCEVWDKFTKKWITIDPLNFKTIEQVRHVSKLEPHGTACCRRNQIRYVIGYDRKNGCRDITRRYTSWFNAKIRKRRITKDTESANWYSKVIGTLHKRKRTKIDDYEDEYFLQRDNDEGMPDNLQDLKNHPYYVLEKDIRQNQIIKPGCKECGYLKIQSNKKKHSGTLKVYERKNIMDLKSGKQWYNEGRILKAGARCKKIVKRKALQMLEGEETEERLYCEDDTELYVATIATWPFGEIQKNTFGNVEVFVPSMIPANCCLVESSIAIKAAKFINIEFAPAVTGFKFERGRKAKPAITGVVVANWYREALEASIDGVEYSLEVDKQRALELESLQRWRVLLTKLRIKSDLNATYGTIINEKPLLEEEEEVLGGGFFISRGNDPVIEPRQEDDAPGGFMVPAKNESMTEESESEGQDANDEYGAFMNDMEL